MSSGRSSISHCAESISGHLDLIQPARPVPQVLADGLHMMLPRWWAGAVSVPALRLDRLECRLPLGDRSLGRDLVIGLWSFRVQR